MFDDGLTLSLVIRILVTIGGITSLVLLWRVKMRRWNTWTEKMRDYFVVLLLFIAGTTAANVEYMIRGVDFTAGTIIIGAALILAIRALRTPGGYVKDNDNGENG